MIQAVSRLSQHLTCSICLCLATAATAQGLPRNVPVAYEWNFEGGIAWRPDYTVDLPLSDIIQQDVLPLRLGPAAAISVMRRIDGLRALYGLRAEYGTHDLLGIGFLGTRHDAALLLNYRAFIFDMDGDCDCPTWGRDNWLKRAFFVELGLGGGFRRYTLSSPDDLYIEENEFGLGYLARFGVSHRFRKTLDAFFAAGAHGAFARNSGLGVHQLQWRPALGITWRP